MTNVSSITVNGGSTAISTNVTTVGDQIYPGAITISANVVLTAGGDIAKLVESFPNLEVFRCDGTDFVESYRTLGEAIDGAGYFIQPTVLVNTAPAMQVVREEIFGPVLCVQQFDDDSLEQLAARGNDTEFGLSSSIWTRDLRTAHPMVRR